MSARRPPRDIAGLRRAVARARLRGPDSAQVARARALLDVYLDTAEAHGLPFEALARDLRAGHAAMRLGGTELEAQAARPDGPAARAACAPGCAFCCILAGQDGAVIVEEEARRLHVALAPLAGRPDGRAWHPRACPALDPETRLCRAYDARPMICRTYLSLNAEACREVAEGAVREGPGVLGAQGVALAVTALARAALDGVTKVPTYGLARVAEGAVAGEPLDITLRAARHRPRVLDDERARLSAPAD